jgi:hypothetical protein
MKSLAVFTIFLLAAMSFANGQESAKPVEKKEVKAAEATPPTPKPLSYYRLDFVVNELEDSKKTNSRSYTVLVEAPGRADFKVGSRLPVSDGHGSFNFIDVGLQFGRVFIQEKESMLEVNVENGDISSVAAPEQGSQSGPPVIRQARFSGNTVVAPGKPTVLFSLDDVNSKHRFQIELTATKLK